MLLGVPVKSGKSKKIQMVDIERHVKLSKGKGYSLIVDEIYTNPKPKKDGRGNFYGQLAQLLLTDYFMKTNKSHIINSSSYLMQQINMINENYRKNKNNIKEYSNQIEVDENVTHDFYDTTDATLKTAIETALKNLENRALILYTTEYIVKPVDSMMHREATAKEKEIILFTRDKLLRELGHKTLKEVLFSSDQNTYKLRMSEILKKRINIEYAYKGYSINILQESIAEKQEEMIITCLSDAESKGFKDELNDLVMSRLMENAIKRQQKLSGGFGKGKDKKQIARRTDDYVHSISKIIDDNINSRYIENEVQKVMFNDAICEAIDGILNR